jgi:hypothetical protein
VTVDIEIGQVRTDVYALDADAPPPPRLMAWIEAVVDRRVAQRESHARLVRSERRVNAGRPDHPDVA